MFAAPLKAGSAVMTSAGALQCKNIAQMVGPDHIADITASLGKVLNLCEGTMATTLAIPAIGTGMTKTIMFDIYNYSYFRGIMEAHFCHVGEKKS